MPNNYKEKEVRIFEASWELFLENGFHDTKISEIAKKAGIGKGTVYEYFKTKEEIFEKLVTYKMEDYMENLEKNLEETEGVLNRLKSIVNTDLIFFDTHAKVMPMYQSIEKIKSVDFTKMFMNTVYKKHKLVHDILEQGIKEGIIKAEDPLLATGMFMGSLNNITMTAKFGFIDKDYIWKMYEFVILKLTE